MKTLVRFAILSASILLMETASAYSLKCANDGQSCNVYCDSGQFVGTMYWNGSNWSDGLRSGPDRDAVAKQMVAAQGSACT